MGSKLSEIQSSMRDILLDEFSEGVDLEFETDSLNRFVRLTLNEIEIKMPYEVKATALSPTVEGSGIVNITAPLLSQGFLGIAPVVEGSGVANIDAPVSAQDFATLVPTIEGSGIAEILAALLSQGFTVLEARVAIVSGYNWTVEELVLLNKIYCEAWTDSTADVRRDITEEADLDQIIADMKVAFPGSDRYIKHLHYHAQPTSPCLKEEV